MTGPSLYRRLLGADFDRLPEVLQRFHGAADSAVGAGSVDVRVGQHLRARLLARVLRLPSEGDTVPVTVTVQAFGERRLRTVQWTERGRLLERVGALTFAFDVSADERGLRFRFAGLAAFGVRVPRRFALRVDADVTGFIADWHVNVTIRTPGSRLITSYGGRIAPLPSP